MPTNDYFDFSTGNFPKNSKAFSATMRALVSAVNAAFDLMPERALLTGGAINSGGTSGVANTYAATIGGIEAYAEMQRYTLKFNVTNTGASTLNINGLGARPLLMRDNSPLLAGAVMANQIYEMLYNTSDNSFHLINQSADPALLVGETLAPSVINITNSFSSPAVNLGSRSVSVVAGVLTLDLSAASAFYVTVDAGVDPTFDVVLTGFNAEKSSSFSVIFTTIGLPAIDALLMDGVVIWREKLNLLTLEEDGRTVFGCLFNRTTLDVFRGAMELNV